MPARKGGCFKQLAAGQGVFHPAGQSICQAGSTAETMPGHLCWVQPLMSILPYVAEEEVFALKDGTAINMFIRDMPRLSVDIDLTYLPLEDRATSLAHIAAAFPRIARR